jgi:hypothetical protein
MTQFRDTEWDAPTEEMRARGAEQIRLIGATVAVGERNGQPWCAVRTGSNPTWSGSLPLPRPVDIPRVMATRVKLAWRVTYPVANDGRQLAAQRRPVIGNEWIAAYLQLIAVDSFSGLGLSKKFWDMMEAALLRAGKGSWVFYV